METRNVKVGERIIEDLVRSDLVEIYADLWRLKEVRDILVGQGVQTVGVSKHRSGSGDKNSDAGDIALAAAFPKYRIPLVSIGALEIFRTHGALATSGLPEIQVSLVLASATDVNAGSDPAKVGT